MSEDEFEDYQGAEQDGTKGQKNKYDAFNELDAENNDEFDDYQQPQEDVNTRQAEIYEAQQWNDVNVPIQHQMHSTQQLDINELYTTQQVTHSQKQINDQGYQQEMKNKNDEQFDEFQSDNKASYFSSLNYNFLKEQQHQIVQCQQPLNPDEVFDSANESKNQKQPTQEEHENVKKQINDEEFGDYEGINQIQPQSTQDQSIGRTKDLLNHFENELKQENEQDKIEDLIPEQVQQLKYEKQEEVGDNEEEFGDYEDCQQIENEANNNQNISKEVQVEQPQKPLINLLSLYQQSLPSIQIQQESEDKQFNQQSTFIEYNQPNQDEQISNQYQQHANEQNRIEEAVENYENYKPTQPTQIDNNKQIITQDLLGFQQFTSFEQSKQIDSHTDAKTVQPINLLSLYDEQITPTQPINGEKESPLTKQEIASNCNIQNTIEIQQEQKQYEQQQQEHQQQEMGISPKNNQQFNNNKNQSSNLPTPNFEETRAQKKILQLNLDETQKVPENLYNQEIPKRQWREQIQDHIGFDAICMGEFLQELLDLELDVYKETVQEYAQLVTDIQSFRNKKQELIEKEEFELLIVIRDTLRAKEPIAMSLKNQILYIGNVMNLFKQHTLKYHVLGYLKKYDRKIPKLIKDSILLLQPEIEVNQEFISTSVLKLIKLRNQLDKIKYEQKYINFINGLKRIIQMSYRFDQLSVYIDSTNEALQDLKIEKQQYQIQSIYIFENTLIPYLHSQEPTLEYCNLCYQASNDLVEFRGNKYHIYCVNFNF